jgi:hypothetical protein
VSYTHSFHTLLILFSILIKWVSSICFIFSFLWKIIIWVCCWLIQNNASCESMLHCCCYCLLFKIVFLHTWYGGDLYDF